MQKRHAGSWQLLEVFSLSAPLVKRFTLWTSYAIILLLLPHMVEGPLLSWFLVASLPVMNLSLSFRPTCGKWPVVWKRYPLGSSTKSTSSLATSRRSTTSITSMLVGGFHWAHWGCKCQASDCPANGSKPLVSLLFFLTPSFLFSQLLQLVSCLLCLLNGTKFLVEGGIIVLWCPFPVLTRSRQHPPLLSQHGCQSTEKARVALSLWRLGKSWLQRSLGINHPLFVVSRFQILFTFCLKLVPPFWLSHHPYLQPFVCINIPKYLLKVITFLDNF